MGVNSSLTIQQFSCSTIISRNTFQGQVVEAVMALANPRILSISSDIAVFDSRNRVLESAGFEVVPSFCGNGALEKFTRESVDAVVLGDSLSAPLRIALFKNFRTLRPSVPIVVVYRVGEQTEDVLLADAAVESLDGPERLIEVVSTVIHKSPQADKPNDLRRAQKAN
jgi:DNA-binding response OmpR family regulator